MFAAHDWQAHADADPRMNPRVVPTAVELLMIPLVTGEAFSVV